MGEDAKSAAGRKRGPAKPLTKERIVAAALGLIDSEGLGALSMRRLGKELGVDPMAVYYHVPNKSALYDAIMDEVLGGLADMQFDPGTSFEDFIVLAGCGYRDVLLRHRRALPLLTGRSLRTEHTLMLAELMIGRLHAEGLTLEEATAGLNSFSYYVAGAVNAQARQDVGSEYHEETSPEEMAAMLPAEHFPNLLATITQGAWMGDEQEFEFMLRVMARGFLASAAQRKGGKRKG